MTQKELAEAINQNKECIYDGGKYRYIGYQILKHLDGSKAYSAGLLDLKTMRTVLWVDMKKL